MPAAKATSKRNGKKRKLIYEAFISAAGSWNGLIDVEQFKKDIYVSRKISTRPPVKL